MTGDTRPRPGILRVFYDCPAIGRAVDGSTPLALDTASAVALAKKFLSSAKPEDFFGLIDDRSTVLQMYLDAADGVWLEVPAPEQSGSFGATLKVAEAVDLLAELPKEFSSDTVPGAKLRPWKTA